MRLLADHMANGRMTTAPPERNNPGYTPVRKELEEARSACDQLFDLSNMTGETPDALRWLAAEVRVMRLERALER